MGPISGTRRCWSSGPRSTSSSSTPWTPPRLADDGRLDPVFMLGFPRSGTTLVQQILQCHPQIQTLDEADPAMGALRAHLAGTPVRYPECLDLLTDADWRGHSHAAVMRLWLDRRATLPLPWREQRYEPLTVDLEGEARAMLSFLGLEWEPAVLAHHERSSGERISTPSRYDVRRPVYREAVGRWVDFERHLAPILPTLAPFVTAFGY